MATVYSQRNILIPIEMIHRIVGDLRKGWIPSADAWKDPGPMGDTEGDIPTSIDAADIEVIPLDAREEVQVTLLNNSVEEFLAKSEVHLDGTTTPTPSVTTAGTGDEFSESDASELAEDIAELVDAEDDVITVYQKKSSEFGTNKLHAPQMGTQRTACKRVKFSDCKDPIEMSLADVNMKNVCKDCVKQRSNYFKRADIVEGILEHHSSKAGRTSV